MARVAVIGSTGHIGSYLVPRLAMGGHEVVAVSRGNAEPYITHSAWDRVQRVHLDRDALEKDCDFGKAIAELKPDVVIDNICFTLDSARQLAESL